MGVLSSQNHSNEQTSANSRNSRKSEECDVIRIGAGAGFAGDRIDPAAELAERGDLDYLVFECLGERTVALGQQRRRENSDAGYDPLLDARMRAVLPACRRSGTRIITNSGSANPLAAGRLIERVARELGLAGIRVGVVTGDDVTQAASELDPVLWETGRPISQAESPLLSANAYIGAEPIREALAAGADVVVTGRAADPSLYVGPLAHEFGWDLDDPQLVGRGTLIGHLLECAGQLTGGYFADPLTKPVPDMARLGFPYAEVSRDGSAVLTKVPDTGGRVDTQTCAEQLLYEVSDPGAYLTPDVTADFSGVRFEQVGPDRVAVTGGGGRTRPDTLKVTLGFDGGWQGEGQLTYAGPRCLERARWAGEIVRERLIAVHGLQEEEIDVEFIGAGAAFRGLVDPGDPIEVRLRVAVHTRTQEHAKAAGWEVEALYTNGPAGGGGARRSHGPVIAVRSADIPRDAVRTAVTLIGDE